MASPQVEDGFTQIANEILVALSFMNLSPNESKIINCVIRQTYGWHKKEDWISQSQFVEKTAILRQHVWRTIQRLKEKKMLVTSTGYKKHPTYGFQKDYDMWKMSQKVRVLMLKEIERERERRKKSTSTGYTDVPVLGYTKDTLTKETVKKEEREFSENPFSLSKGKNEERTTQVIDTVIESLSLPKDDNHFHEWFVREQASMIKQHGIEAAQRMDWIRYARQYYPGKR